MDKKLHIVLVTALLIFSACTERLLGPESEIESSHSYIFFEQKVVTSVESKANLITEKSLPKVESSAFGVIGYAGSNTTSIFSGNGIANVYWDNTVFKYDNLAIWHGNETVHRFYAYYPYSIDQAIINQNSGNPYILYTQPTTESTMQEVLTAYQSMKRSTDLTVPLEFHHRLWALEVEIKNSQSTGLDSDNEVTQTPTITITGIDVIVKNFPTSARIYLNDGIATEHSKGDNGNVTLTAGPTTYSLPVNESENNVIAKDGTRTYGHLLFLPVSSFKYQIVIKYLDSRGKSDQFTSTEKTATMTFAEGTKYTLKVNKTNDQFVLGQYDDPDGTGDFQPGDWNKEDVYHTFN